MTFDIDTKRAKSMARTLKSFLDADGKGRYSHVNALEAVARMLGYRNHNAMLADLPETATGAPTGAATGAPRAAGPDSRPLVTFTVPVASHDPETGAFNPEAALASVNLADLMHADNAAIARLRAAYEADCAAGLADEGRSAWADALDGQPDIDRVRAVLGRSARPRIADLLEGEIDPMLAEHVDTDSLDPNQLTLWQLSPVARRRIAQRLRPTPAPQTGECHVVETRESAFDADGRATGTPTRTYWVVQHQETGWTATDRTGSEQGAQFLADYINGMNQTSPGEQLDFDLEVERAPRLDSAHDQAVGRCTINGTPHHITLFRVPENPAGTQRDAASPRLDALRAFENVAGDTNFQTLDTPDGAMACVITPFTR